MEAGQIHCVIGPNGGGKTSLVRAVLGQMPHSGKITVTWGSSNKTGYVPQHLDFDKSIPLSVNDFMALACQRRPAFLGFNKTVKSLVDIALDRVGLVGKRDRKLGSLSGGERQRVLFAQALVPQPALLVLDEPMTGMDETGGKIFEQIVREEQQKGVTVIWIAHDLRQVERMAQSVTCINRTILFQGPAKEVMTKALLQRAFNPIQPGSLHKLESAEAAPQ